MHGVSCHTNATNPRSAVESQSLFSILQEVIPWPAPPCRDVPLVIRDGREDAESTVEVRVDRHDRGYVATSVAVVGGGPDRDDGFFGEVELRSC